MIVKLPVGREGWVLEVGSGHNPHPRSDILVDGLLESDAEREGGLKRDRPLVVAFGEALPFKSKSFDFAVCSHVLEHALDPLALTAEVQRVAKAGYVETPSSISERLFNWPYHRWLVDLKDGGIVMRPKRSEDVVFGFFFHELNMAYWEFRWFLRRHKDLFNVRYFWTGRIDCRVEGAPEADKPREDFNKEMEARDAQIPEAKRDVGRRIRSRELVNRLVASVKAVLLAAERLPIRLANARRRRSWQSFLESALCCPACKDRGELRASGQARTCSACGRTFRKKDGVWDFRLAAATPSGQVSAAPRVSP